jgi:hypothetical protein
MGDVAVAFLAKERVVVVPAGGDLGNCAIGRSVLA